MLKVQDTLRQQAIVKRAMFNNCLICVALSMKCKNLWVIIRHICEYNPIIDAAIQLEDFYRELASPLLNNVKFEYVGEIFENGSITKTDFQTYFKGGEYIVAGKLSPTAISKAAGTLFTNILVYIFTDYFLTFNVILL